MKRTVQIVLTLVLLLGLCACGAKESAPTWQEQYDLGVRYLEDGDYEEAIIAFTAAIEIDPKRAEAYVGRGDAYVLSGDSRGNLRAARADYEKAIELDETLASAYLGLADVYIRRDERDKAFGVLQQGYEKTNGSDELAAKMEEIEKDNSAIENEVQIDILNGFWESNGYRLSDTFVYQFCPDGTYIGQMGVMSIPFYGKYEYNGHTLTLLDKANQVENVFEYDVESQCFISSTTTVMVEQAIENPEGVYKFAAQTLNFIEESPIGFFEDEFDGKDLELNSEKGQNIRELVDAEDSTISAYLKETVKQYVRNNKNLHFVENAENIIETYELDDFHYYIKDKQIILYFVNHGLTSGADVSITIPTNLFLGQKKPPDLAQLLISSESNGPWTWYDDQFSPSRGMNLLVGEFYFRQDMTSTMAYGYYCSEYLGDITGTYTLDGDILIMNLVDNESQNYHYEFQIEPIGDAIAFKQISESGPFHFYTVGTVLILQLKNFE